MHSKRLLQSQSRIKNTFDQPEFHLNLDGNKINIALSENFKQQLCPN